MSRKTFCAYVAYRCRAKHRKGHGVHSPFMYELVRTVFSAKKMAGEPRGRQERALLRLNTFCAKHALQLVEVRAKNDLMLYKENCIALLAQPHANAELWHFLAENKSTRVTADCWAFGLALAVPHLQKQHYVVKI